MPALHKIIAEVYRPKSGDEQRFFDKHVVKLFDNIYSKPEYDKLFKGQNVKTIDREKDNHGYNPGSDEKVYESASPRDASDASAKNLAKKGSPIDPKKDPIRNLERVKANTKRAKGAAKSLGLGEEVDELEENWTFHDLMGTAHSYTNHKSRRGKHKMGHVAQAAVETAKDLDTDIHSVMHHAGITRYGKNNRDGDDIIGGRGALAGMKRSDANKKVSGLFNAHLKDCAKRNVTFNPSSHPSLCEELADRMLEIEEEFELNEMHVDNMADHLKAIKDVADKHGLPKSLVAGSVAHAIGRTSVIPSTMSIDRYGDSPMSSDYHADLHADYNVAKKDAQSERMENLRGLTRPGKSKRKLSAVAKKFLSKKKK